MNPTSTGRARNSATKPRRSGTGHDQHDAGQDRERRKQRGVRLSRIRGDERDKDGRRRDRDRGARPDVELAAGTEDRVEDAGRKRRREPRFRRRSGERRVRNGLRHEDGPDRERSEQIASEERAPVGRKPVDDRDEPGEATTHARWFLPVEWLDVALFGPSSVLRRRPRTAEPAFPEQGVLSVSASRQLK